MEATEKHRVIESRVPKLEISGLQKGTELILLALLLCIIKWSIFVRVRIL